MIAGALGAAQAMALMERRWNSARTEFLGAAHFPRASGKELRGASCNSAP